MLPEAALATLEQFKQHLTSTPRAIAWSVPHESIPQIIEAQESLDGLEYAKWAAEKLVEMLKRNELGVRYELTEAKLWYEKILLRRYLVKREFLEIAYQRALELAEKR